METKILDTKEPSELLLLLEVLKQNLPYSLPLLRRLQFLNIDGNKTSCSHVLSTFERDHPGEDFLIASVDLSRGPETEIWLYSSLEHPDTPSNETICEEQVLKLFARVEQIEKNFQGQGRTPGIVMVASLHAKILEILEKHSMVKNKTEEHFKFVFKMDDLPAAKPLPGDLLWSSVRASDIPLVLSRTAIPYQAKSMVQLPSVAIITELGVPIAWAFLGVDGSLKTLHCEEEYRGRGLAKSVTLKLFREKNAEFGRDGYSHADVAVSNFQSQGVCKSLKGAARWTCYFAWIDVS